MNESFGYCAGIVVLYFIILAALTSLSGCVGTRHFNPLSEPATVTSIYGPVY